MQRTRAIITATALEVLSEPLSLLVLLVSLALTVLAPTFHYHQFGEATRMARDAGFSAMLTGGLFFSVFGTIRTFRREIETGTREMALAHPVSRAHFNLAKVAGVWAAALVFLLTVFGVMLVVVQGAAVGGRLAEKTGDVARIWGPCVAAGIGVLFLPLVVGAILNRFGRFRFVLSAFVLAVCLAVGAGGAALVMNFGLLRAYFAAALPLVALATLFVSASAAFALRFKAHVAASCAAGLFVVLLPLLGNFDLAESLARGGSVAWGLVGWTFLATLPGIAAFLVWVGADE